MGQRSWLVIGHGRVVAVGAGSEPGQGMALLLGQGHVLVHLVLREVEPVAGRSRRSLSSGLFSGTAHGRHPLCEARDRDRGRRRLPLRRGWYALGGTPSAGPDPHGFRPGIRGGRVSRRLRSPARLSRGPAVTSASHFRVCGAARCAGGGETGPVQALRIKPRLTRPWHPVGPAGAVGRNYPLRRPGLRCSRDHRLASTPKVGQCCFQSEGEASWEPAR